MSDDMPAPRRSGAFAAWLTAAVLLLPPAVSSGRAIRWKEASYNPRPLEDDVVLPMPCGGAMAFRPVLTEASGPFGDQRIELGNSAEATGPIEHTRPAFIAGPFRSDSPDRRRLLVGKYEVTDLQYGVVMDRSDADPCPEARPGGRLPRTGVSWHDAVSFAHRYSLWLRETGDDLPDCDGGTSPCLPRADGSPAFVRLPTEVEWEFAARGGAAVTPAEFRATTPPLVDGMERQVWYTESADGELKPVGVLDPNPLGLHDMLGNAEEMVLEPFRLNRLDRLHGQPGGFVVRGGSVHSAREEIRSSLRREVPYYDEKGAVRTADTGFRLVASVPVIRSNSGLGEIRAAWGRLGLDEGSGKGPTGDRPPVLPDRPFDDPLLELSALVRAAPDPVMQGRLERLRALFAADAQRLYDQRNRAARESLRFGGLLCQKLHDEGHNLEIRRTRHRLCADHDGPDHPRCRRVGDGIRAGDEILEGNIRFFADTVVRTAENYAADLGVLAEQLRLLKGEMELRGIPQLTPYPDAFHAQVLAYILDGRVHSDRWYAACRKLR